MLFRILVWLVLGKVMVLSLVASDPPFELLFCTSCCRALPVTSQRYLSVIASCHFEKSVVRSHAVRDELVDS